MTVRAVKRNILIIEDKADIRLSLRLLLCNHGYEVFEACDPPAATELLAKQAIDLILLDMNFEFDTTSGSEGLAFLKAHKINNLKN